MRSRQPKVLHPLCGRPLIAYPLRLARALADRVVRGRHAAGHVAAARGPSRRAHGRAARASRDRPRRPPGEQACGGPGTILVLPGDMPLLRRRRSTHWSRIIAPTGAAATILTADRRRPEGYGRVLRAGRPRQRIVEDRDATDDEKKIAEINTSVYCFEASRLWPALAAGEARQRSGRVLPDRRHRHPARAGARVEAVTVRTIRAEALGVNDRKQLAVAAASSAAASSTG